MFHSIARRIFFAATILSGGLGPNGTSAATLPPAGWVVNGVSSIQFGDNIVSMSNPPVPMVSVSGAGGSASLQFSPTPTPSITAAADGYDPAASNGSAFAQGVFRYFGQVVAPGGLVTPTSVNVTTHGSLFSQAGPGFGSDARVKLEVFGISVVPLTVSTEGDNNGNFTRTMAVAVNTNQTFAIEMLARAWTFEPGVSATAFLDPFFSLDQTSVDLGYTLQFSEGMGNSLATSPVPVPAAFPMFVTGLAGLGWLARRRTVTTHR